MQRRRLNHWLVGLGMLFILAGLVDAVGVVEGLSQAIYSDPSLAPAPPEDFGNAEVDGVQESNSGFLPLQAPSEPPAADSVLNDSRLQQELKSVQGLDDDGGNAQLPALPPAPPPEIPRRLWIPAIELYAPIIPVELELIEINGVEYDQWKAPNEAAAGWHTSSASLGAGGNTVLNGHHNIYGEVFRDLVELVEGDEIILYSDNLAYRYQVVERVIFPERFAKPEQRVQNAQLILPSQDERLTLITCWPYESNTHRLVLVAKPAPEGE
jgi:LPXTG-site transpeptidase (sortase) family protein